ncbi:MAG: hypothetical protein ACXAB4_09480 [Candidatus Hodarchaeales archaeon]|jgi:hypothetical protein
MTLRKRVRAFSFTKRHLIIFSWLIIGLALQLSARVFLAEPGPTSPWRENQIVIIGVLLSMVSLVAYFVWALYETADPQVSRMKVGFKWLGLAILLFGGSWLLRDFQEPLADISTSAGFWCGAFGMIDVCLSTRAYHHPAKIYRPDYFKKAKEVEKEEEE